MASKRTKAAPADDNLDELFSGIGGEEHKPSKHSNPKAARPSSKPRAPEQDPLADLESQLAAQQASSRPHTPRVRETGGVPKRSVATPPAFVEDKTAAAAAARKSTDSSRSLKASFTPSATSSELYESERKGTVEQVPQQSAAAGWWGGIVSMGSAAVKQAQDAYKEIQQNDEAKKWAEQVRGLKNIDVGSLRNYGKVLDPSSACWAGPI